MQCRCTKCGCSAAVLNVALPNVKCSAAVPTVDVVQLYQMWMWCSCVLDDEIFSLSEVWSAERNAKNKQQIMRPSQLTDEVGRDVTFFLDPFLKQQKLRLGMMLGLSSTP